MQTISDAYMAGLFDGEGCVSVIVRTSKGYSYHQLDLRIAMTSLRTLEAVQKTYGGNLHQMKKQKPHHKEKWQWYCQGAAARHVLQRILPFVIEKRPQVDLGIRFQIAYERGLAFDHEKVRLQFQWLKRDTTRQLHAMV